MSLYRDENHVYVFLCTVLLAVRMVADVTETRNVIPSLDFKTCMTIKVLSFYCFEPFWIWIPGAKTLIKKKNNNNTMKN